MVIVTAIWVKMKHSVVRLPMFCAGYFAKRAFYVDSKPGSKRLQMRRSTA